jgi:uncharacterized protein YbaR (Trm112 family)/2-polyprenyl-3-methyl-5-hydroxy-6-metoxy-1,4-benzoquinol methylase
LHQSTLDYLRCVHCQSPLDIVIFDQTDEINEGILKCIQCKKQYPVISSIPIILQDFPVYFSIRTKLGGDLLLKAKSMVLKNFVKNILQKIKAQDNTSKLEENWVKIYKQSKDSIFYSKIANLIKTLPKSKLTIEHGCSIGIVTHQLAKKSDYTFGVDKSFYAIEQAKKNRIQNCDFLVADSLCHPFGKTKFDTVVGLNLLELIEPKELLDILSKQTKRFLIMSDPYDYERGKKSVKEKWDEKMIRKNIIMKGFKILTKTKKPSYLDWNLTVNPRLELRYKVDVIVAKKY